MSDSQNFDVNIHIRNIPDSLLTKPQFKAVNDQNKLQKKIYEISIPIVIGVMPGSVTYSGQLRRVIPEPASSGQLTRVEEPEKYLAIEHGIQPSFIEHTAKLVTKKNVPPSALPAAEEAASEAGFESADEGNNQELSPLSRPPPSFKEEIPSTPTSPTPSDSGSEEAFKDAREIPSPLSSPELERKNNPSLFPSPELIIHIVQDSASSSEEPPEKEIDAQKELSFSSTSPSEDTLKDKITKTKEKIDEIQGQQIRDNGELRDHIIGLRKLRSNLIEKTQANLELEKIINDCTRSINSMNEKLQSYFQFSTDKEATYKNAKEAFEQAEITYSELKEELQLYEKLEYLEEANKIKEKLIEAEKTLESTLEIYLNTQETCLNTHQKKYNQSITEEYQQRQTKEKLQSILKNELDQININIKNHELKIEKLKQDIATAQEQLKPLIEELEDLNDELNNETLFTE